MSRERKLQDEEHDYLGPVAIAQFVELGWLHQWPLAWSHVGLRAVRNGYGRWEGSQQTLPIHCEDSPHGAAAWKGRRAVKP